MFNMKIPWNRGGDKSVSLPVGPVLLSMGYNVGDSDTSALPTPVKLHTKTMTAGRALWGSRITKLTSCRVVIGCAIQADTCEEGRGPSTGAAEFGGRWTSETGWE